MKIIEHETLGNPADVLELKQVQDRTPGAGEARVKVLATPIHPANLLQISGQYAAAPDLPAIPGGEGVGTVVELGAGVEHLQVGQNVLLAGVGGTWRDEIVAPAAGFIPAPPGDVEQLSMLAVNPMTAHLMLADFADLEPGDWIIQSAANSAVGEMVIQLAAQKGINTVNIVRREDLILPLKSLGATVALVDGPDLAERVQAATGGAEIKLAMDCVGGDTFERLVETLGYGGSIVVYGTLSGKFPELNMRALIANDVRPRGFWLQQWYTTASQEQKQAAMGALVPLIASGAIKTRIDSRFPLEEIGDAVNRAAASGRDGKVLLVPNAV
ncbi:MAG: zinc-dependent alcohol dehydrogenase family protein [Hyphomonadaceae bacterium]|nr:zinc-dependent alcohol dehydrogenase family protein [Hyphomonadaceae bacterium]